MCIWMHLVSFISILPSLIMNMLQCKRSKIQSKQTFLLPENTYSQTQIHTNTHMDTHTHTQTQIVAWLHIKV